MTDNEIIVQVTDRAIYENLKISDNAIGGALFCCMNKKCYACAYKSFEKCEQMLKRDALDLFDRNQAEIKNAKSEAVKEFVEKIKTKKKWDVDIPDYVLVDDIDNLAKERVGDSGETVL